VPAPEAGLTASIAPAHMVDSSDEVGAFIDRAEAAGAAVVKPAQKAFWGGHHGYFADPSGFLWEVAHNPGLAVDTDGTVSLVEITPG
jgi:uncharacterized protein